MAPKPSPLTAARRDEHVTSPVLLEAVSESSTDPQQEPTVKVVMRHAPTSPPTVSKTLATRPLPPIPTAPKPALSSPTPAVGSVDKPKIAAPKPPVLAKPTVTPDSASDVTVKHSVPPKIIAPKPVLAVAPDGKILPSHPAPPPPSGVPPLSPRLDPKHVRSKSNEAPPPVPQKTAILPPPIVQPKPIVPPPAQRAPPPSTAPPLPSTSRSNQLDVDDSIAKVQTLPAISADLSPIPKQQKPPTNTYEIPATTPRESGSQLEESAPHTPRPSRPSLTPVILRPTLPTPDRIAELRAKHPTGAIVVASFDCIGEEEDELSFSQSEIIAEGQLFHLTWVPIGTH